jgi:uroporphyrinogen-III synthase
VSGLILLLRPEPGAGASAERARRLGLEAVTAPLFTVRAVTWEAPDPGSVDAILLTSAQSARQAGPPLERFLRLPCHTVGDATAAAAREAGFGDVRTGPADGAAALAAVAGERVLHLCGRDHVALAHPRLTVERRIVYAADAVEALPPQAADALERGALALIHSPRAGAVFARLVDEAGVPRASVPLAAISEAAAAAAGGGWRSIACAGQPRDEALLELARQLCQTAAGRVRE